MPLRLNVGLSRKLGLPDYGSLGASCNLDFELDATLLQTDPESLQRQIRNAYDACRRAVHEELARNQAAPALTPTNNPSVTTTSVGGTATAATVTAMATPAAKETATPAPVRTGMAAATAIQRARSR